MNFLSKSCNQSCAHHLWMAAQMRAAFLETGARHWLVDARYHARRARQDRFRAVMNGWNLP